MIYLFLSIAVSSLIFIIFKGFGKYNIDNFQAIIINYVTAGAIGLFVGREEIGLLSHVNWLHINLIVGVLFISLFTLMATVSQKQGVSVASVAVKMSVVIPVIAGVIFHNESLDLKNTLAIFVSLIAIWLVTQKTNLKFDYRILVLPLILFFGNGSLDALLKYAQVTYIPSNEISLFTSLSFGAAALFGILSYPIVNKQKPLKRKNIIAGIVLGIPNFGSIYFLLKAISETKMDSSVFFPINNVGIVVLSTFMSILIFKEVLSLKNWIGVGLGLISIVIISL